MNKCNFINSDRIKCDNVIDLCKSPIINKFIQLAITNDNKQVSINDILTQIKNQSEEEAIEPNNDDDADDDDADDDDADDDDADEDDSDDDDSDDDDADEDDSDDDDSDDDDADDDDADDDEKKIEQNIEQNIENIKNLLNKPSYKHLGLGKLLKLEDNKDELINNIKTEPDEIKNLMNNKNIDVNECLKAYFNYYLDKNSTNKKTQEGGDPGDPGLLSLVSTYSGGTAYIVFVAALAIIIKGAIAGTAIAAAIAAFPLTIGAAIMAAIGLGAHKLNKMFHSGAYYKEAKKNLEDYNLSLVKDKKLIKINTKDNTNNIITNVFTLNKKEKIITYNNDLTYEALIKNISVLIRNGVHLKLTKKYKLHFNYNSNLDKNITTYFDVADNKQSGITIIPINYENVNKALTYLGVVNDSHIKQYKREVSKITKESDLFSRITINKEKENETNNKIIIRIVFYANNANNNNEYSVTFIKIYNFEKGKNELNKFYDGKLEALFKNTGLANNKNKDAEQYKMKKIMNQILNIENIDLFTDKQIKKFNKQGPDRIDFSVEKPLDTLSSPYKNLKLSYKNKEIGLIKNKKTIAIYNHNTGILNNLILAYRRFQKYLYMDETIEITKHILKLDL